MPQQWVIANWKMHGRSATLEDYAEALSKFWRDTRGGERLCLGIAPPALYLPQTARTLCADASQPCRSKPSASESNSAMSSAPAGSAAASQKSLCTGAQDLSPHVDGAHTGEISAEMLRDCGAHFALVGHSERRQAHHGEDALVRAKCEALWKVGLRSVLCVGESAAQRENGLAEATVQRQLHEALDAAEPTCTALLIVAYEPLWAIGTGRNAAPEDVQAMHRCIRAWLGQAFGAAGNNVPVLYGGSVKAENAAALFAPAEVDGALVGGACLRVESFLSILQAALHSRAAGSLGAD